MAEYTNDYLLNRQVKIFQPVDGYRASTDAVILSSLVQKVKKNDKILDVGSGTGAISLCLAARFQEIQPQITGIEIQPELAELSARSAEANGFSAFLHYVNADIRQKITTVPSGARQRRKGRGRENRSFCARRAGAGPLSRERHRHHQPALQRP